MRRMQEHPTPHGRSARVPHGLSCRGLMGVFIATATNQQWLPTQGGNGYGYYALRARNGGLCLEVPNSSTANGVQLVVDTCNGGSTQAFQLTQQPQ